MPKRSDTMRINVNVEGIDALTSRLNKLCNIENALLKGIFYITQLIQS